MEDSELRLEKVKIGPIGDKLEQYPQSTTCTLISLMRRAGISLHSNMPEGVASLSRKEDIRILLISAGSLEEFSFFVNS